MSIDNIGTVGVAIFILAIGMIAGWALYRITNNKEEENSKPIIYCPYNDTIECHPGLACDSCAHDFDDIKPFMGFKVGDDVMDIKREKYGIITKISRRNRTAEVEHLTFNGVHITSVMDLKELLHADRKVYTHVSTTDGIQEAKNIK